MPVGTVYAERQSISNIRDFVGRVEATGRVDIRARVQGYLEQVLFKEGDIVKKGDQLYQIEKGLFQAAVEAAKGALERSKAAKTLTAIQLQRAQELLEKNAGTAVARDQALAADQQAQGQILADQANLDTANINLGYTDIASPISGKGQQDQCHGRQCRRARQRRPDADRQPGSDVHQLSGQPARTACRRN